MTAVEAARPSTDELGARSDIVRRLADWATEQGLATPVFGLVRHAIPPAVARLRTELGARLSYALKANPHPLVVAQLADVIDEFNVTNLAQLDQLLADGIAPERIAWLHPILTPDLADTVFARGIRRFVVDDEAGLDLLLGRPEVRLTLRLLPPDLGEAQRSVVRFGNTEPVLRRLAAKAVASGLGVEAISFFVGTHGSDLGAATPFKLGIEAASRLYRQLVEDGVEVATINIGGGFPGARQRFHLEYPDFFHKIRQCFADEFPPDVVMLCEPGRYIAEPTLVLLSRVIRSRTLVDRNLTYLDTGAYNGLFEQSIIDPEAEMSMWTIDQSADRMPSELLGPVMDSFDVIRKGYRIPRLHDGEYVAFPGVGAYSTSYSVHCEGLQAPQVRPLPDEISLAIAGQWYP